MSDPYLHAQMTKMQWNEAKQRELEDFLEVAISKNLDFELDSMTFDDLDPKFLKLTTSKQRRIQMKSELQEALNLIEYQRHTEIAIKLIHMEWKQYFNEEQYHQLQFDFANSISTIEAIDLVKITSEDLSTLHNITLESRGAIANMAIAKYKEAQYDDCLSLFMFLVLLNPYCSDYWFRSAIAAQNCKIFSLAATNFITAAALNPKLFTAHIFAAHCFLNDQMHIEAKEEFLIAKNQYEAMEPKPEEYLKLLDEFNF